MTIETLATKILIHGGRAAVEADENDAKLEDELGRSAANGALFLQGYFMGIEAAAKIMNAGVTYEQLRAAMLIVHKRVNNCEPPHGSSSQS